MSDAELLAANQAARSYHRSAVEAADVDDYLAYRDLRDVELDRAATAVMETGKPGRHHSQHDQDCHLFLCELTRTTDAPAAHCCDRSPGCHWPSAGGDGR